MDRSNGSSVDFFNASVTTAHFCVDGNDPSRNEALTNVVRNGANSFTYCDRFTYDLLAIAEFRFLYALVQFITVRIPVCAALRTCIQRIMIHDSLLTR